MGGRFLFFVFFEFLGNLFFLSLSFLGVCVCVCLDPLFSLFEKEYHLTSLCINHILVERKKKKERESEEERRRRKKSGKKNER